jgi:hypothetical protein
LLIRLRNKAYFDFFHQAIELTFFFLRLLFSKSDRVNVFFSELFNCCRWFCVSFDFDFKERVALVPECEISRWGLRGPNIWEHQRNWRLWQTWHECKVFSDNRLFSFPFLVFRVHPDFHQDFSITNNLHQ